MTLNYPDYFFMQRARKLTAVFYAANLGAEPGFDYGGPTVLPQTAAEVNSIFANGATGALGWGSGPYPPSPRPGHIGVQCVYGFSRPLLSFSVLFCKFFFCGVWHFGRSSARTSRTYWLLVAPYLS